MLVQLLPYAFTLQFRFSKNFMRLPPERSYQLLLQYPTLLTDFTDEETIL